MGNELQLWNVTDPANPVMGSTSRFRITNLGDSDYDLVNYSVCDDCRYGIANFKLATVLFDLGTASAPTLSIDREYHPLVASRFGFTFSYGGVQYVLSDDLEDGSGEPIHCAGGGTPLVRMSGIYPTDLTKVGCVEDGAGGPFEVAPAGRRTRGSKSTRCRATPRWPTATASPCGTSSPIQVLRAWSAATTPAAW
jgi:hypothetical protein